MTNLNKLIPIFGIMGVDLFFSISSILGYQYYGIDDSKVYIIYCIIVAILNLSLCLGALLLKNLKITLKELLVFSFPFIILSIYLLTGMLNNGFNTLATSFFCYFLLWSVPAIYVAIYVNKSNIFNSIVKWFEIIMLVFSLSIITSSFIPFLQGANFSLMGGATYQSASYIAAFAFGLNLYFLCFGENHERFNFTSRKIYKYICIFLLFLQLSGIFLSGGRGGIILATAYTIYISFSILKSRNLNKINTYFLSFIVFIIFIMIVLPILLQNDIFRSGFDRVFEFISSDGKINWDGTSNRDDAYLKAIELISENPIFGYGLYGFWEVSGYPHNIILEILLNGGITYLIFSTIIFTVFLNKLFKMIKFDRQNRLLLIIFLYPITMLLFSGTYMTNTIFWFVITVVFTYKNKLQREV